MKHQTPESMKFRKLLRLLGCSKVVLVGTLELLWISVQKNAPQGDIGKFSNEEIAIECEWEGDPDDLVESLVQTGWLDVCENHRMVVHNWSEHCPGWVRRQLARHKKSFVEATNGNDATGSSLLAVTDDAVEATPNQTQPNPTKPNTPYSPPRGESLPFDSKAFASAWATWVQHRKEKRKALTPTSVTQQFRKFTEWGESRSIAAIQHTVAMGWQGLREPEVDHKAEESRRKSAAEESRRQSRADDLARRRSARQRNGAADYRVEVGAEHQKTDEDTRRRLLLSQLEEGN